MIIKVEQNSYSHQTSNSCKTTKLTVIAFKTPNDGQPVISANCEECSTNDAWKPISTFKTEAGNKISLALVQVSVDVQEPPLYSLHNAYTDTCVITLTHSSSTGFALIQIQTKIITIFKL